MAGLKTNGLKILMETGFSGVSCPYAVKNEKDSQFSVSKTGKIINITKMRG